MNLNCLITGHQFETMANTKIYRVCNKCNKTYVKVEGKWDNLDRSKYIPEHWELVKKGK